MDNKKVSLPKYKKYKIIEKYGNYVMAKIGEETERLSSRNFLDFDDVSVGSTWVLYKDKRNEYSYFSNLFNIDYLKERFKPNTLYKGIIFREVKDKYIVKVDVDKYIKVPKNLFFEETKIGDEIEFYIRYNSNKSMIYCDLNRVRLEKLRKYLIEEKKIKNKTSLKLQICSMYENNNGTNYIVYYEELNLRFEIFERKDFHGRNEYLLERNAEILGKLLILGEVVERHFFINLNKQREKLDIEKDFKERIEKNGAEYGTLKLYTKDDEFYIENEDIGAFKLEIGDYSLVELTLLETLDENEVYLVLNKNKRVIIEPLPEIYKSEGEVFENLVIEKVICTFSKKIIYKLKFADNSEDKRNHRIFIDEYDYDYLRNIQEEGTLIEKAEFKYNVKDLFIFCTRLPYIENPIAELLKDKEVEDSIIARVDDSKITNVDSNYIDIILGNKYRYTIYKEDLKRLTDFRIRDFYEPDKLYNFYIEEKSKNGVHLLGYNPRKINEIFNKIQPLTKDREGDIISCYVKKAIRGLVGYYEEDGEQIEVEVPNNEISYLNTPQEFRTDIKYQFMVIEKDGKNETLKLSRKRLSKNVKNELQLEYPVGSLIGGIFFASDENGCYFNLTNEDYSTNIGDLIGFLPYTKIGLYPDVANFKNNLLLQGYKKYRIVEYPKIFNSFKIKEKAIELELENQNNDLNKIVKKLEEAPIVLDLKKINTQKLLTINPDKDYFEKEVNGVVVVFAMDRKETAQLEALYKNFQNRKEDLPAYGELFDLFKGDSSILEVAFKSVDKTNNTLEVSFRKKIQEVLENLEFTFEQDIDEKLLFGDEILNIQVEVDKKENFISGNHKYKIRTFDKVCGLEVVVTKEELIGKEIKVAIIKNIKSEYLGKFNGNDVVVSSKYPLKKGEDIICKVKDISEEYIYAELIELPELMQNCANYIESYIQDNVESISVEELQDMINLAGKKAKFVLTLEKYRSEIFTSRKIEKYLIARQEFSNGAFGKVYKGIDLTNGNKVILKRYSADKSMEEYISFKNEAKLLSELDIPSVIKVFWYKEDEYIGEFIEGITYREFLKSNKSQKEKIEVLIKIARAIDAIHAEDIYHLDIKPENILIDNDREVKLIDFGSCQSKYEPYGKYGTLIYSSPFQCWNYKENSKTEFSQKDDIYSFGIMMYETFVGQPPYPSSLGEDGIIKGHLEGRMTQENIEYKYLTPSQRVDKFNLDLEDIINKCLEFEEEDRYDEIFEIEEELNEIR